MKRFTLLFSIIIIMSFALSLGAVQKPVTKIKDKPVKIQDEIVVKYAPGVTPGLKEQVKNKFGLLKKRESHKKGAFVVYKHGNPKTILKRLKAEPGVLQAEQNAYAYAFSVPNDPYFPIQWHMSRIHMESAWDLSTGSGAVVAVVDTGVKQSLEDLAETTFMAGWDFVNNDNDPKDDEGHGSHVCGTIAQSTNNSIGVAGIAFNATIMPVKVLDRKGSGSYDDIADGIYYAADNGAHVINLSLGGASPLTILEDAINYAWNKGVVVVCAAGNDGVSTPFYPAAYPNAISVSATGGNDDLASYSNYGSTIDISAPGGDSGDFNGDGYDDLILQNTFVRNSEGYYFFQGTSMASPHVAGVAALVKSANPGLSNTEIRNILESTAEDLGDSGWDEVYGHGLLDALAAVTAAGGSGPVNQSPVAEFTFATSELTVTFTDASSDPDGNIAEWAWNFGDGQTASVQNPVHTYAAAGTYTVALTVTDNEGAQNTVTHDVTVTSGPVTEEVIHVADIAMSLKKAGRNYSAIANITVLNTDGQPVSNATVSVTWSGLVSGSASGITGADGKVSFESAKSRTSGTFTVTVTSVSHATAVYDPAQNVETSDSISN